MNEAKTKHLFDNRYGTGQSTIDGIIRATNVLLAGRRFVVAGYGWVGRGVAMRARGMGAHVIVTEVDPMRALEAADGRLRGDADGAAAEVGDIFCTATGDKHVLAGAAIERMKDGAILANTGHFNVEIDIPALRSWRRDARRAPERGGVRARRRAAHLPGRRGPAGQPRRRRGASRGRHGHELRQPGALGRVRGQERRQLEPQVYDVPEEIDREIARLKLETMGVEIDRLTEEQAKYLASWDEGT